MIKRAIKSGKARRPVPLKAVTMRLPLQDLKVARELAARKSLSYQTYIKMLLMRLAGSMGKKQRRETAAALASVAEDESR